MFLRGAGTYPNERNEPIIMIIVNDNNNYDSNNRNSENNNNKNKNKNNNDNNLLVHSRCLPKIRLFPPISLVGDTSGGWCGKRVHVMMKLWGKMVNFFLQRGPSAHAEGKSPLASWTHYWPPSWFSCSITCIIYQSCPRLYKAGTERRPHPGAVQHQVDPVIKREFIPRTLNVWEISDPIQPEASHLGCRPDRLACGAHVSPGLAGGGEAEGGARRTNWDLRRLGASWFFPRWWELVDLMQGVGPTMGLVDLRTRHRWGSWVVLRSAVGEIRWCLVLYRYGGLLVAVVISGFGLDQVWEVQTCAK